MDVSLDQFQELVARHWARGIGLLDEDWQNCSEDFDKFIIALAGRAGISAEGNSGSSGSAEAGGNFGRPVPVVLSIGELSIDQNTQKKVTWTLNAPGVSPHIAVMGMAGTGKTRVARTMLTDIRRITGTPVILFDMAKGDLAGDKALVDALGATVLNPLEKPIPLDVLSSRPDELKKAAMRFRDTFKRVPRNKIGDAQGDVIREAAERAYAAAKTVRIADIFEKLRQLYAEKRKKDDVVIASFRDLTAWELFAPELTPEQFFKRSWIVDLHKCPDDVKRLVVFLLFDAVQGHLSHLEDTVLDEEGNRALRVVVAVDEARLVLGFEHQSLISLVRESRSKGGVVMFISQSPDDFDQKSENFLENIGLTVCFRTNARSSALSAAFGGSVDTSGLDNGVCVTRLVGQGLTHVKAWSV